MIESFASDETKKIFLGKNSTKLPKDIQRTARRKLLYLDDAEDLQDLLAPPGNRLEKLKGDRAGQYSIRINEQWRICFQWSDNKAKNVEIVDYHQRKCFRKGENYGHKQSHKVCQGEEYHSRKGPRLISTSPRRQCSKLKMRNGLKLVAHNAYQVALLNKLS